jgi:hypothetical protein
VEAVEGAAGCSASERRVDLLLRDDGCARHRQEGLSLFIVVSERHGGGGSQGTGGYVASIAHTLSSVLLDGKLHAGMASPTGSSLGLKLKDKTKKLKGKIFGPSREPSTSSLPAADSVSASDTSGTASTESWWSKNREEIFASVRQVLDVTEKALDGVPVPGAKAIVAGVSEVLKIYQVREIDPVKEFCKLSCL